MHRLTTRLAASLLALLTIPLAAAAATRPTVTVAAAADLIYCLEDLNAEFVRQHPDVDLKVTTGASGNIFAQIKAGAPFDVFLSADLDYPRQLASAALADGNTLLLYATGHLALWTANAALDVSNGLAALRDPAFKRIAIANPDVAPYGRAAKAALQSSGVWDAVQSRLVKGENISQTAQFVQTGNADVGLVSLSFARSPRMAGIGHFVEIPESLHPRLEQGGVVTAQGRDNPLATAYMRFLGSREARAVFDRYGFLLPATSPAIPDATPSGAAGPATQ